MFGEADEMLVPHGCTHADSFFCCHVQVCTTWSHTHKTRWWFQFFCCTVNQPYLFSPGPFWGNHPIRLAHTFQIRLTKENKQHQTQKKIPWFNLHCPLSSTSHHLGLRSTFTFWRSITSKTISKVSTSHFSEEKVDTNKCPTLRFLCKVRLPSDFPFKGIPANSSNLPHLQPGRVDGGKPSGCHGNILCTVDGIFA